MVDGELSAETEAAAPEGGKGPEAWSSEVTDRARDHATRAVALRDRFLALQLAGDARGAAALLSEAWRAGADPGLLEREVVAEAQREVGRRWAEGRLSVAEEHLATSVAERALALLQAGALAEAAADGEPRRPPPGRVLVACVAGELHALPARLVAHALERDGFEVRFLGADVPPAGLVDLALDARADLIALSVTMAESRAALVETARWARERTGGRVPVLAGGQGLRGVEAAELGVVAVVPDAAGAVKLARRLRVKSQLP